MISFPFYFLREFSGSSQQVVPESAATGNRNSNVVQQSPKSFELNGLKYSSRLGPEGAEARILQRGYLFLSVFPSKPLVRVFNTFYDTSRRGHAILRFAVLLSAGANTKKRAELLVWLVCIDRASSLSHPVAPQTFTSHVL